MTDTSHVPGVTDATFEEVVLKSPTLVVVDFWADWCPPCRKVKPLLPKLAAEFAGKLTIVAYDVEKAGQKYYRRYKLEGIPSILFFKDGKPFKFHTGALPYPQLKELFNQALVECAQLKQRRLVEARKAFEEAIARAIHMHDAAVKTAETRFSSSSNLITSDIMTTYHDALEQHESGAIDDAALQTAYETFRRAYDERVGGCRAERDEAKASADREYERAAAEAARLYKEATSEDAPAIA